MKIYMLFRGLIFFKFAVAIVFFLVKYIIPVICRVF